MQCFLRRPILHALILSVYLTNGYLKARPRIWLASLTHLSAKLIAPKKWLLFVESINNKFQKGLVALSKAKTFFLIATSALKDKGLYFFLERFADYLISFWTWQYYKRYPPSHTFTLQGERYKYFYNLYNITWKNERALEIPVAWDEVEKYRGKKILEVGNVLSWYFQVQHDVLDKYEVAEGVINEDIVEFKPAEKYDLILSISTLEHVGWDETPREPRKVLDAVERLKGLLNAGGKLLITVPLGYNTALDEFLRDGSLDFTNKFFMKRVSKKTEWAEIDEQKALDEVRNKTYRRPEIIMIATQEN
jgi:hypothetical protein